MTRRLETITLVPAHPGPLGYRLGVAMTLRLFAVGKESQGRYWGVLPG